MTKRVYILIMAFLMFASCVSAEETLETINAEAGRDFTITLESNGSTGYQWQLAEPVDENFIQLVESKYIDAGNGLPGAPGKEEWTFKPIKTGRAKISLEYIRPWERGKPLTAEYRQPLRKKFTVVIGDAHE